MVVFQSDGGAPCVSDCLRITYSGLAILLKSFCNKQGLILSGAGAIHASIRFSNLQTPCLAKDMSDRRFLDQPEIYAGAKILENCRRQRQNRSDY